MIEACAHFRLRSRKHFKIYVNIYPDSKMIRKWVEFVYFAKCFLPLGLGPILDNVGGRYMIC